MFRSFFNSSLRQLNKSHFAFNTSLRHYSPVMKVPELGDSISEGTIVNVFVKPGDIVPADKIIFQIETAKVTADVRIPENGKIIRIAVENSQDIVVGQELYEYEKVDSVPASSSAESKPVTEAKASAPKTEEKSKPVEHKVETPKSTPTPAPTSTTSAPSQSVLRASSSGEGETRVKMTRMRKSIAQRLKESQNTNALLTTFNEIDMSKVMKLREDQKDWFQKKYGIKLGFMGFFCKAAAIALKNNPTINAVIDGDDIVYRDYVDISVAVATPKGLVTPVIRNCESLSVAEIELEIANLAKKARDGKIEMSDLQGGTFTISNGGVYGSMFGTPIVNPPQSAILGMHATKKRPVVVTENGEDKIVIRPVMFTALTYDHRLIDGQGAVTFLKELGEIIANPETISMY